jgi:hypothetical protein
MIKFPGHAGRLRLGNRLDQARIVVPDIADALADRPADHVLGRVGRQQRLELRHLGRFFTEPCGPGFGQRRVAGQEPLSAQQSVGQPG